VILLGMGFAEGSASDWIAYATVHGHGLAESAGALLLAVFSAAMTIGRVLGGPLLDRAGRVPVLRATAALGILGVVCFVLGGAGGVPLLAVGVAFWGLGASLGFPVGMSAAADDPQHAAARLTAAAMIGYLAFLAGPPLLGALGQSLGILVALLLVPLLLFAAGLASPAARERRASAPHSAPDIREA
jgi:MFS family permease